MPIEKTLKRLVTHNSRSLCLAAVTALMVGDTLCQAAHAAPCEMHLVASVPARLSAANKLLIGAAINDTPVELIVDTGASASLLSAAFAKRMGMTIEDTGTIGYGLSDRPINQKTFVRTLKLGKMVSANEPFALMPAFGDGAEGAPVGLFGADYLQNYDVEIDIAGGRLNLFSQDHCADQVVYWAPEYFKTQIYFLGLGRLHRPALDILVDGQRLRAIIDTGAFMTVMRTAVAQDRFDLKPDSPEMRKLGSTSGVDGKRLDTFEHVFHTMVFGDLTLHDTRMAIAAIDSGSRTASIGSHLNIQRAEQPDMLVGMNLLKRLHFLIAYGEKALYYTIAPAKPATPS